MTVALTLGQVVTAASAVVVNILSAAVLLPAERGVLALLLQVTYLLAIAVVLGVERPFLRQVNGSFSGSLRVFIRLVRPGFWLTLVPLIFAVLLTVIGRPALALAAVGMAAYIFFNAIGKGVRVSAIASSKVKVFFAYVLVTQGGTIVFALALASLQVDSAIIWYFSYVASGAMALLFFLRREKNGRPLQLSENTLRGIRKSGLRLLPASFGNTAMVRSDRLLLPLLAGTAQLGIYAVVATVMEIATWPVNQWVDASLHRWARSTAHSGLSLAMVLRTGGVAALLSAGISIVLGLTAHAAISYLLPVEYAPAKELILPLGVASVVYAVSRTQQGLLVADGYSGRVSLVEICGLVAALASYFALIPSFGALGAAYGSIAGYTFSVLAGLAVHILSRHRRTRVVSGNQESP